MFNNPLKLAFRNLKKNKSFSLINIFGLSLGMASCFLIILYVWHEFNYDNFHPNGDRLYRIEYTLDRGDELKLARIPSPINPALADYFPEIEASSRFYPRELSVELSESKKQFELEDVFFVDSSAINVFDFEFIHGNSQYALNRPESVVITDKTANFLFGKTDVIGESLRLAGEDGFQISGVVKAWPDNSHLAFEMLLPFETMYKVEPQHARENIKHFVANNWSATHSYNYVKLAPNQQPGIFILKVCIQRLNLWCLKCILGLLAFLLYVLKIQIFHKHLVLSKNNGKQHFHKKGLNILS